MRKKTPDTSKLSRANAAPYTLRKVDASAKNFDVVKDKTEAKGEPGEKVEAKVDAKALAASDGKIDAKFDDVKSGAVPVERAERVEPEPVRARAETVTMPVVVPVGGPPDLPAPPAVEAPPTAQAASHTVEDPTNMPAAKAIPDGSPTDPALPPGLVPPGDSRSFRRSNEFALVYRQGTAVISRFGTIGQRGQWRVVEYPTSASASNSYAKECSRFVADGFSDYRE